MQEIKALEQLEGALSERYDRVKAAIEYFEEKRTPHVNPLTQGDPKAEVEDPAEVGHIGEATEALQEVLERTGSKVRFIRYATGSILTVLGFPNGFGEYQYGEPGTKEAIRPEEEPQADPAAATEG